MKKIDLRKCYPNAKLYGHGSYILVSDEVANVITEFERAERNYYLKKYRYKAYYSLDYDNGIENSVIYHEETPEEIYERKLTIQQLNQAIAKLPIKQGQHIYSKFFLGKSCQEIAAEEHVSARAVQKSLRSGLGKLSVLLKNKFEF